MHAAIDTLSRRRVLTGLGGGLLVAAASPRARAAVDPHAALQASDQIRNPSQPFSITVAITEYTQGRQTDANELQVYSRIDPTAGQFRSLMRWVAPARDANKLMLKSGNDLWFYDPASRASVRISPRQRLLGQASNGDVVTVNYARAYAARLEAEEDTTDGDRQTRRSLRLMLEASADDVTYPAVQMWLDASSMRPIKARFQAEGGRLLKTAYYRRYQDRLGAMRPTEIVIIDGLNPALVTIMRYEDFQAREIPESWFQRDFLARFAPQ